MLKPYFIEQKDAPKPLRIQVKRRVRFEEVDALGIVWHGRYASYFEDARSALGENFGIGYLDLYRNGIVAPIKKLHMDYHRTLRFPEEFSIEGILHWSDAARINHEFIIRDSKGSVITTGYSVQVMLDKENNLYMVSPTFYQDFCRRWKAGELK
jgi:acyl-CoA thioester hydrolase